MALLKQIPLICLLLFPFGLFSQSVDGGNGHAVILDEEGYVFTIGRNNFGQLGIGSKQSSDVPVQVPGLPKCKAIARGYDFSLAIDTGGFVWAWGRNNYGQLGGAILVDRDTPRKVWLGKVAAIEGGHWHTVALREDGTVNAWGHNFKGELGNLSREHNEYPVDVLMQNGEKLRNIAQIVCVGNHTLALDSAGNVYAWGNNHLGQLGHFHREYQPYATQVAGLTDIVSVAVGWHHSLALDREGRVFAWGSRPEGEHLGIKGKGKFPEITYLASLPPIKKIACGSWHSIAVDEEGRTWTWGRNDAGMLGTGDTLNASEPVLVEGLRDIEEIGGGCFQSLAVDKEGKIWTSGRNSHGQQGQPICSMITDPVEMVLPKGIEGLTVQAVQERMAELEDGGKVASKGKGKPEVGSGALAEAIGKVETGKRDADRGPWESVLLALLGVSLVMNIVLVTRGRRK